MTRKCSAGNQVLLKNTFQNPRAGPDWVKRDEKSSTDVHIQKGVSALHAPQGFTDEANVFEKYKILIKATSLNYNN